MKRLVALLFVTMSLTIVVARASRPEHRVESVVVTAPTTTTQTAPQTPTSAATPTTEVFTLESLTPALEWILAVSPTTSAPTTTTARPVNGGNVGGTSANNPDRCAYADLIRSVWKTDSEWAIQIAWRESRCIATARHPEGASGLFQMMLPLHHRLFESVGCNASQWSDPSCNVRAAWFLYQGSGRRPWRL